MRTDRHVVFLPLVLGVGDIQTEGYRFFETSWLTAELHISLFLSHALAGATFFGLHSLVATFCVVVLYVIVPGTSWTIHSFLNLFQLPASYILFTIILNTLLSTCLPQCSAS